MFAARAGADQQPKEDPAVTELLQSIKGKENRPAGEVFKNVTILKTMPAARFLRIMDFGYSRSLGVGCDHCHARTAGKPTRNAPRTPRAR